MAIVKVKPKSIVEAIFKLAESVIRGASKIDPEQASKLDAIREMAECSESDFMEIKHEYLILFINFLPKSKDAKDG